MRPGYLAVLSALLLTTTTAGIAQAGSFGLGADHERHRGDAITTSLGDHGDFRSALERLKEAVAGLRVAVREHVERHDDDHDRYWLGKRIAVRAFLEKLRRLRGHSLGHDGGAASEGGAGSELTVVPEPGTLGLAMLGLLGISLAGRRRPA